MDPAGEVDFRRFVAARWGALQRYAYLLTGDHHAAEDVVQTALETCWRRWGQIRSDSPESYVRAAVANAAASRRRRKRFFESPLLAQPSVALALSTKPATIRLSAPPRIARDGAITPQNTVLTPENGVYAQVIQPTGPSLTFWVDGRQVPGRGGLSRSGVRFDDQKDYPPVRGGAVELAFPPGTETGPDGDVGVRRGSHLDAFANALQAAAGQDAGASTFRLLAAQQAAPMASDSQRAWAGVITLPSGARVLGAGYIAVETKQGAFGGLDTARLLPAGTDDDLSIAWVEREGMSTDGMVSNEYPGWAGALGPAGTTSVEWVHGDGEISSESTVNTLATIATEDVVSVRFYNTDGERLGETAVTPLLDESTGTLPEIDAAQQS